MSDDEPEYDDVDELLDNLPWAIRNKVLREVYGDDSDRIEPEPVPDPPPYVEPDEPVMYVPDSTYLALEPDPPNGRESALWWTLLPFAVAGTLTLVALASLASAMLLWPVAMVLLVLASVPVGIMTVWRLRTKVTTKRL